MAKIIAYETDAARAVRRYKGLATNHDLHLVMQEDIVSFHGKSLSLFRSEGFRNVYHLYEAPSLDGFDLYISSGYNIRF